MSMSYSANNNQNYFVEEGRTTSRVLAPPGGKASFTLGTVAPAATSTPQPPAVVPSQPALVEKEKELPKQVEAVSSAPSTSTTTSSTTTAAPGATQPEAAPSCNAFVSGSNMNGGIHHTGRPTSRVLAPPGGFSSFKLG